MYLIHEKNASIILKIISFVVITQRRCRNILSFIFYASSSFENRSAFGYAQAFAGDGAEDQGAEEIHKKDFRDTELQSLLKSFQRPATAPAVDGGQGVAGQGYHILYRDRIRVFAQQLFIVDVH